MRVLLLLLGAVVAEGAPPEIVALTTAFPGAQARFTSEPVRELRGSWHVGCPVGPAELREVSVPFWDFAGRPAQGVLVVNAKLVGEIETIFRELFEHGFLIEKMGPVEEYGGSDDQSMEANNTSAFNCRDVTGVKGKFSNHSWGRAIDINPLTNPYVKGGKVLPPAGRAYLDRTRAYPGGILQDGFVVSLFAKHGWTWGGAWPDRQDYQHFEKPER